MKPPEGPLVCRACGARPEQRRDDVSANAQAYTCSACLVGKPGS